MLYVIFVREATAAHWILGYAARLIVIVICSIPTEA